jgi:hypothetical protein
VHKITFGLSQKEIQSAIKQLEEYKKDLTIKCQRLIETLTARGIGIAKLQVRELGAFYTGELEASVDGYYSPSLGVGIIYAGAWYAAYVEFGTGIKGAEAPHPESGAVGWIYDINGHGESGWIYFNEKDGRYHWTDGMPSRPFMYQTVKELDAICEKVAKEVFR